MSSARNKKMFGWFPRGTGVHSADELRSYQSKSSLSVALLALAWVPVANAQLPVRFWNA